MEGIAIFANLGNEVLLEQALRAEKLPAAIEIPTDVWGDIQVASGETIRALIIAQNEQTISAAVIGSIDIRQIPRTSITAFTVLATSEILAAPPKPAPEPATRGNAPQEEDLTEEAKQNLETKKTPPAKLERMKQGPKSLTRDVATATPEAGEAEVKAIDAVTEYEAAITALQAQIAEATAALNKSLVERKTGLTTALETLYALVDKEKNKAVRYKDQIVAVDSARDVKEANLTEGAEAKAKVIVEKLAKKKEEIKELNAELEELTLEQFRKHGGVQTETERVTMFPNPALKSALAKAFGILAVKDTQEIRAGLLEMLKKFVSKITSLFKDDGLEKDIEEYANLAKSAA